MPSPKNVAIFAPAGSRKTGHIIQTALAQQDERVLVLTYTKENQVRLHQRLVEVAGSPPTNVTVMGWFSFLVNECCRPYQRALLDRPNVLGRLNFKGERPERVPQRQAYRYYLDSNRDIYRNGAADFAFRCDEATSGKVIARLAGLYDHILIDEVQDMVGYDLEVIDLLLRSGIQLTMVGDPRQFLLQTNMSSKNKQYRGTGLVTWFQKRSRKPLCVVEQRTESYRCNQEICDFADGLFEGVMLPTTSKNIERTGHDGIFEIKKDEVDDYVRAYHPTMLRWDRRANTLGYSAVNIGVAKGATYDRVLVFPTKPMQEYVKTRDRSLAGSCEKLYVAATRARYSVAFVMG